MTDPGPEDSVAPHVPAVDVDDVSVSLGDVRVLDGVSAAFDPGRVVGLVGPNGAGKTTLLRAVRATLPLDGGSVSVAGERVHELGARAIGRLVASVPQDTSLSFDFDVREVVAMGRTPHRSRFAAWQGADADAVERALDRASVAEFADRPVTELSGGERQRVLLARALAQDAPVLLLDEPTGHLDVNHQVRTFELLADLAEEGRTVVAAVHDLNLAARYCDELLLLVDGRVLAHGPPGDVLTAERLRTAFDANAAVSRDPVTGAPLVTALADRPDADGPTGRVHVVCGGGRAGPLLARLSGAGHTVTVGAVPAGSADAAAAEALSLDAVTVPPFGEVDDATADRVRALVAAADATVLVDPPLSAGARRNLEAATAADATVVVERAPNEAGEDAAEWKSPSLTAPGGEEARDGRAVRRYASLRAGARVVAPDDLLLAVAEAVASPRLTTVEGRLSD